MIHTGLRRPDDPQRLALRERVGVGHPKVLAAIARMEANLETAHSAGHAGARCGRVGPPA